MRHTSSETSTATLGTLPEPAALIGRLLALRSFDQSDHPVEESLTGVGGDLDPDVIRENLRSASDGAAVATGLANHGSTFAGDHRLVHRRDAFDNVAVAGNDVAGLTQNNVARAELRR
jgi:hypothetical protein